jgi:hypothetical protein
MKKAKNHFSKVARPGRWQDKRPNGEEYRSVDFDLFLDPSCPADAITSAHWTVPEGLTIKYQWVEGARAYIVIFWRHRWHGLPNQLSHYYGWRPHH